MSIPDMAFAEVCAVPETGCARCGAALTGRKTRWCSIECRDWWYENHRWTQARWTALVRRGEGNGFKATCVRCGSRKDLEVDHVIPRHGEPLSAHSCLHHQANLRVLCHDCHAKRYEWDPT